MSVAAPNTFVAADDGSNFNSECRWAPDGTTLAYLEAPISNSVSDLEFRDFNPGAYAGAGGFFPPRTIVALAAQNRGVSAFEWAPGSDETMAYIANQDSDGVNELFSITEPSAGDPPTTPIKLNAPFASSTADVLEFAWSPDASRVAYIADTETNGVRRLFISNADGSGVVEISDNLSSGEEVVSFDWSADSTRLVFSAGLDARTTIPDRVYVATADGADVQLINTTLIASIGAIAYTE